MELTVLFDTMKNFLQHNDGCEWFDIAICTCGLTHVQDKFEAKLGEMIIAEIQAEADSVELA